MSTNLQQRLLARILAQRTVAGNPQRQPKDVHAMIMQHRAPRFPIAPQRQPAQRFHRIHARPPAPS
jgi:hypothetical protein